MKTQRGDAEDIALRLCVRFYDAVIGKLGNALFC